MNNRYINPRRSAVVVVAFVVLVIVGTVVDLPGRTKYRVCCERGVVRICADTEVER